MKFNELKTGNFLKGRRLRGELKECVSIAAKRFPKVKSTIVAKKKQFPVILDQAITVHKSQGRTIDYMQGNLN